MRQVIDVGVIWRKATKLAEVQLQEHGGALASNVPADCPYSLDDLLAEDFDFDAALTKLTGK